MISPAAFNYYLECLARGEELWYKANACINSKEKLSLRKRALALVEEVPNELLNLSKIGTK